MGAVGAPATRRPLPFPRGGDKGVGATPSVYDAVPVGGVAVTGRVRRVVRPPGVAPVGPAPPETSPALGPLVTGGGVAVRPLVARPDEGVGRAPDVAVVVVGLHATFATPVGRGLAPGRRPPVGEPMRPEGVGVDVGAPTFAAVCRPVLASAPIASQKVALQAPTTF